MSARPLQFSEQRISGTRFIFAPQLLDEPLAALAMGGRPEPMSDADVHRYVQTWWTEREARTKQRPKDPNLKKKPTREISQPMRAPPPLVDAADRLELAAEMQDSLAAQPTHLSMGLDGADPSDDELEAVLVLLDLEHELS